MNEQDTETRFIGGDRVLLVRKYTGGRRRKSSDIMSSPTRTEKCLLERNVNLIDTTPKIVEKDDEKPSRNYGLIGTGAVAATALIGAWFYVQNSE